MLKAIISPSCSFTKFIAFEGNSISKPHLYLFWSSISCLEPRALLQASSKGDTAIFFCAFRLWLVVGFVYLFCSESSTDSAFPCAWGRIWISFSYSLERFSGELLVLEEPQPCWLCLQRYLQKPQAGQGLSQGWRYKPVTVVLGSLHVSKSQLSQVNRTSCVYNVTFSFHSRDGI